MIVYLNIMEEELKEALREFKEWNTKRKQQEKDEAEGRSSSVQEIERWAENVNARQRSNEQYSKLLESHIYRGSGSKAIVGEIG